MGKGHLSLAQVAQSPVQPDLEHCQWWGIHSFYGQAAPRKENSYAFYCTIYEASSELYASFI